MCILSSPTAAVPTTPPAAQTLPPQTRQQLALDALAGASITDLANHHRVSRKFVYQQSGKAQQALADAFDPPRADDDDVLFDLPVTETWLKRFILSALLVCHSSYRGVHEMLRDLFHCPRSLGYLHSVAHQARNRARTLTMSSSNCPPSASPPTMKSSKSVSRCWSASMSIQPIAIC